MLDFLLIVRGMTREVIADAGGFDIGRAIPRYGAMLLKRHLRRKIAKAIEIADLWNPQPSRKQKVIGNSEIKSRIIQLYQEGYGLRELAHWFRISKDSIYSILRRADIKTRQGGPRRDFYEWENKKAQYHYRCAYCGKQTKQLERDHIMALSSGGDDSMDNIVPACHSCNSSKNARALLDWSKFKALQLSFRDN